MKKRFIKLYLITLSLLILFTSCASTTIIDSIPSDANLYINGEYVGKTPYKHRDTKIVGSVNTVRLEKEKFEVYKSSFAKDEQLAIGPLIGGIFFLFPYLWIMKYKKGHLYELNPTEIAE
jgi:hypothetical protein